MRIENREMKEFVELAGRAESQNLKSLTDLERKTLMAMSKAIRTGKSSIELQEDEKTINAIRVKLLEKQETRGSSFFLKIIKFLMNFFNLRTSSHALKGDIDVSSKFLTENLTKLETIERSLKEKMRSIERLIEEEAPKEQIQKLKKEIGTLSKEKARLEVLVFPMEDSTKAFYEEKREAINGFREQIPSIIRDAKELVPAAAFKEQLLAALSKVDNDEKEFSDQFQKDYTRIGFKLKLKDASKGEFVGFSRPKDSTSPRDYFEFHQEGFNQFFSKNEKDWKLFVQEMVTQTPVNILMTPMLMQMSVDQNTGNLRTLKVGGNDIPLIFDVNSIERNIEVLTKRDPEGNIIGADVKIRLETPLQTGKFYPGQSTPRPIDTIGTVESTMSYILCYNGEEKDIKDVKYSHVFRSEEPKKTEEEAHGFFPVKQGTKEEKTFAKKIKEFETTLSSIKLQEIPTVEKIGLLESEIHAIEEAKESASKETDNDMLNIILERYKSYLNKIV